MMYRIDGTPYRCERSNCPATDDKLAQGRVARAALERVASTNCSPLLPNVWVGLPSGAEGVIAFASREALLSAYDDGDVAIPYVGSLDTMLVVTRNSVTRLAASREWRMLPELADEEFERALVRAADRGSGEQFSAVAKLSMDREGVDAPPPEPPPLPNPYLEPIIEEFCTRVRTDAVLCALSARDLPSPEHVLQARCPVEFIEAYEASRDTGFETRVLLDFSSAAQGWCDASKKGKGEWLNLLLRFANALRTGPLLLLWPEPSSERALVDSTARLLDVILNPPSGARVVRGGRDDTIVLYID